jgi:hypothetical protein
MMGSVLVERYQLKGKEVTMADNKPKNPTFPQERPEREEDGETNAAR